MVEQSVFRGVLGFFEQIGIYDVILPFLIVFAIVFAILEKTKVLGFEDPEKKYTRKNLNSMVAFVAAFLVVASSKLVAIINQTTSQIVLLLLVAIFFLILVGVFVGEGEFKLEKGDPWLIFFTIAMFLGILLIFLNAIKASDGRSWLEIFWSYVTENWNSNVVGSIILLIIVIGIMVWLTRGPKEKKEEKK